MDLHFCVSQGSSTPPNHIGPTGAELPQIIWEDPWTTGVEQKGGQAVPKCFSLITKVVGGPD